MPCKSQLKIFFKVNKGKYSASEDEKYMYIIRNSSHLLAFLFLFSGSWLDKVCSCNVCFVCMLRYECVGVCKRVMLVCVSNFVAILYVCAEI